MASTQRPPSDPPGGRRRRPPTVINLEATEVSPSSSESPPKPQDSADPAQQQQAAETSVPSVAKPSDVPPEQVASEQPEPAAEAKPSEPQPSEPPQAEPVRPAAEEAPPQPPNNNPSRQPWMPVVAGLSGVGGGLVLFLLLWAFGAFPAGQPALPQQASQPDLSPRLAVIEQQLKELAARPAPVSPDTRALTDIAARLGQLESTVAAPRPPVTDPVVLGRITAAENAAKSMADNVAGLTRRVDSLETALRDTNSQLQQLAVVTAELQARVRETGAGADRPSRLAAVTSALRAAVEHGEPFATELAIEKSLGADASLVAALEPFAGSGVPSAARLGQELAAIVHPMLAASAEPPHDSTFLDKLQAHAEKLVRVHPTDEARGDDRVAVLTRIEQRAGKGDVAGALSELGKLPPDVRAQSQLQAWAARAEARGKAVEAAHKLAADAVTALKPGP